MHALETPPPSQHFDWIDLGIFGVDQGFYQYLSGAERGAEWSGNFFGTRSGANSKNYGELKCI